MKKFTLPLASLVLSATVISAMAYAAPPANKGNVPDVPGIRTIIPQGDNYVQFKPNVEYAKIGSKSLRMHLLLPKNVQEPMPLIVWVQGSAWGWKGPQDTHTFIPQLTKLAESGYVVASVEHRITSEGDRFPAQIQDTKAAIRYLRANAKSYNIDPERVGIWGNSSGGHLAALTGTSGGIDKFEGEGNLDQSSHVQAVVDWFGPTDFLKMDDFPSTIEHNAADSPESMLVGGEIQENPEAVKEANPITYITPDDPPFLIMHGDEDPLVPYNQSVLLFDALKKAGHDATMYKIEGAGHGPGFYHPHVYDIVEKFFDQHLKK